MFIGGEIQFYSPANAFPLSSMQLGNNADSSTAIAREPNPNDRSSYSQAFSEFISSTFSVEGGGVLVGSLIAGTVAEGITTAGIIALLGCTGMAAPLPLGVRVLVGAGAFVANWMVFTTAEIGLTGICRGVRGGQQMTWTEIRERYTSSFVMFGVMGGVSRFVRPILGTGFIARYIGAVGGMLAGEAVTEWRGLRPHDDRDWDVRIFSAALAAAQFEIIGLGARPIARRISAPHIKRINKWGTEHQAQQQAHVERFVQGAREFMNEARFLGQMFLLTPFVLATGVPGGNGCSGRRSTTIDTLLNNPNFHTYSFERDPLLRRNLDVADIDSFDLRMRGLMQEFPECFSPVEHHRINQTDVHLGRPVLLKPQGASYILVPVYLTNAHGRTDLVIFYQSQSHTIWRRLTGSVGNTIYKGDSHLSKDGPAIRHKGEHCQHAHLELDIFLDELLSKHPLLTLTREGESVRLYEFTLNHPLNIFFAENQMQESMAPRDASGNVREDLLFDFNAPENQPAQLVHYWQANSLLYGPVFRAAYRTQSGNHMMVFALTEEGIFPQYAQQLRNGSGELISINRGGSPEQSVMYADSNYLDPLMNYIPKKTMPHFPTMVEIHRTFIAGQSRMHTFFIDYTRFPHLRSALDEVVFHIFRRDLNEASCCLSNIQNGIAPLLHEEPRTWEPEESVLPFVRERGNQLRTALIEYAQGALSAARQQELHIGASDFMFFDRYVERIRERGVENVDLLMNDRIFYRALMEIRLRARLNRTLPNIADVSDTMRDITEGLGTTLRWTAPADGRRAAAPDSHLTPVETRPSVPNPTPVSDPAHTPPRPESSPDLQVFARYMRELDSGLERIFRPEANGVSDFQRQALKINFLGIDGGIGRSYLRIGEDNQVSISRRPFYDGLYRFTLDCDALTGEVSLLENSAAPDFVINLVQEHIVFHNTRLAEMQRR